MFIPSGDIEQRSDGLFYMRQAIEGEKKSHKEKDIVERKVKVDDDAQLFGLMAESSSGWVEWSIADGPSSSGLSGSAGRTTIDFGQPKEEIEAGMRKVQEAFDAMTRLTLAVRRLTKDLLQNHPGDEGCLLLRDRGIRLCKGLVDPTDELEELLTKTVDVVDVNSIKSALRSSASKFVPLEAYYIELEAVYRAKMGKKPKM